MIQQRLCILYHALHPVSYVTSTSCRYLVLLWLLCYTSAFLLHFAGCCVKESCSISCWSSFFQVCQRSGGSFSSLVGVSVVDKWSFNLTSILLSDISCSRQFLNDPTGPPVIFVAAGYTYGALSGGYADLKKWEKLLAITSCYDMHTVHAQACLVSKHILIWLLMFQGIYGMQLLGYFTLFKVCDAL